VLLDELRDPDVSKVLEVLDRRGYEVRRKPLPPAPDAPVKVRTGRVTIKGVSYPMHSVPDNADVSKMLEVLDHLGYEVRRKPLPPAPDAPDAY
jgi:hypothetical protein